MESPKKTSLVIPVLLITFGVGWLLTTLDVVPGFDWPWTLGLAAVGLILFMVLGVDKFTVVCAPLLFFASILTVFHQLGELSLGVFVPLLIIFAGILLLIARRPSIPVPGWIADPPPDGEN